MAQDRFAPDCKDKLPHDWKYTTIGIATNNVNLRTCRRCGAREEKIWRYIEE